MTASRIRLLSLLGLAVPIVLVAIAAGDSPAFGALALAAAAGGFAMLLAGPVFRVVLSVLIALLGLCVVLVAVVTPETGSLELLALVGGILLALVAVGVAITARRWPASGSRYSRSRLEGDSASAWDSLSAGDDPTDDSR